MATPLDPQALEAFTSQHEHWSVVDGALQCEFPVDDHFAAHSLADDFAFHAEDVGHHPDLTIGYKKLTVRLRTHDANALTGLDTEFAEWIDSYVQMKEAAKLYRNPKTARAMKRVIGDAMDRWEAALGRLSAEQLAAKSGNSGRTVGDDGARTWLSAVVDALAWIRGNVGAPEPGTGRLTAMDIHRLEDPAALAGALKTIRADVEHTCDQLYDGVMSDRTYLTELGNVSDVGQMLDRIAISFDRARHVLEDALGR